MVADTSHVSNSNLQPQSESMVDLDESANPAAEEPTDNDVEQQDPPHTDDEDPLQVILRRLDELQTIITTPSISFDAEEINSSVDTSIDHAHVEQMREQIERLSAENDSLIRQNEELTDQNETLAAEIAHSQIGQAVNHNMGVDESLSWEERKAAILQQMEADTFDADEFIDSLQTDPHAEPISPIKFVEQLNRQVTDLTQAIQQRDQEIDELRHLLEQQREDSRSHNHGEGVVTGAAAIAGLVDADELIQAERARLQELKQQWEEKFRETEIAASLERAKLSRERQEIAKRASELEEQLDDLKRQQRNIAATATEPTGRRWLAELGLDRS